jgi:hypothetical protein
MYQVKTSDQLIFRPFRLRRCRVPRGDRRLVSGWVSLALALLFQSSALSQVTEIDLTGPSPHPPSTRGVPGGGGGLSGERVGPQPYNTPLQVYLIEVEPTTIHRLDEKFVITASLTNIGDEPFLLPASRNLRLVERNGNRRRRRGRVFLHFQTPPQSHLDTAICGLMAGSDSVPESLHRLEPGDQVIVRADCTLSEVARLVTVDMRRLAFRVGYSERTLRDDSYKVSNISITVWSSEVYSLTLDREVP